MADEPEGGGLAEHLRVAETHFDEAIELFQSAIGRLRDGDALSVAAAEKASKALFNATQTLLNYKMRIYDERKRQEGVVSGYALDLDEAKSKVGRLLDRLRSEGGPREVPK